MPFAPIDQSTRMSGWRISKAIADKWAETGVKLVGSIAADLYETIKRWETDPTLPSSRGDGDIGADAIAMGPGMLLPGFGRAAGGVGAFGGRLSKTADLKALEKAEEMAGKGASREAIWNETGWFQGVDKKWRYEINDQASAMSPELRARWDRGELHTKDQTLGEGFSHPELQRAYPQAGDVEYIVHKSAVPMERGSHTSSIERSPELEELIGPFKGRISATADTPEGVRSVTLHEAQHRLQAEEGFARGGMANARAPDQYNNLAGEVEARNVQARRNLGPQTRREIPPWHTQDTPEAAQIVRGVPSGAEHAISTDDVLRLAGELGLQATVKTTGGGTSYVRLSDPAVGKGIQVRIPSQENPHGGPKRFWRLDTSVEGTANPHGRQMNAAGEVYDGNLPALRERLQYTFGKYPPERPAASFDAAPADPRQLKLLSGGFPVPAPRGWDAEVSREDAGRFARPVWSPDMMAETRWLTTEVGRAADDIDDDLRPDRLSLISRSSPWRPMTETRAH